MNQPNGMFDLPTGQTQVQAQTRGQRRQADAYVNLGLPAATPSGQKKAATVYLHSDTPEGEQLIAAFQQDPEAAAEWLKSNIIVDFQVANSGKGFDMSGFKPKFRKKDDEGVEVTLYEGAAAAWFIGREGDDIAYHPTPMGAFGNEQGARKWADHKFPGGTWEPC